MSCSGIIDKLTKSNCFVRLASGKCFHTAHQPSGAIIIIRTSASDEQSSSRPTGKEIGKATLWSVGNAATAQGLTLLAFLVTTRLIDPAAFGIVAVATLIVEVIKRLLIEPLAIRLMSYPEPELAEYNQFFSSIVLFGGAGALAMVLLAQPIAWGFGEPLLASVLPFMAALLVGTSLWRTHEIWFTKNFKFRSLALRSAVAAALGSFAGIVMAFSGFGIWSLVTQQLVSSAVLVVLLVVKSAWRPKLKLDFKEAFTRLSSVRHFALINGMNFVAAESDVFYLTYFTGPQNAGIYSAAKRLVLAANIIVVGSIGSVVLSVFSRGREDPGAHARMNTSLSVVGLVFFPVFVGLSLLSQDVVSILLSHRWYPSGAILSVLALSTMALALNSVVTNYLIAARADGTLTRLIAAAAISTILILPILAQHSPRSVAWGVAAIAWSSFIAICVVAARREKKPTFSLLRAVALPAVGAVAMAITWVSVPVHGTAMFRLLILAPALLLLYVAVVALVGFSTLKRLAIRAGLRTQP